MKRILYFFCLILFIHLLPSCAKNLDQPAYLEIKPWKLEANPLLNNGDGELTHYFTDAWVYIDDALVGVFELPCKVPVVKQGKHRVTIFPTVRNNGIAQTKKIYPFAEEYIHEFDFDKGKSIVINPVTRYKQNTVFNFVEDFEAASMKIMNDPTSKTSLQQVAHTDAGRTGHCGLISLTTVDSIWTGNTHADLVLPKTGSEVYLEIDFKNTNRMLTGVLAIDQNNQTKIHPYVYLAAQTTFPVWKKAYIDLREIVSYSTDAAFFEIYFQAIIPSSLSSSYVYIDNVKVIHF